MPVSWCGIQTAGVPSGGGQINAADVLEAAHKNGGPVTGWHTYTHEQLEVAQLVAATLVDYYELTDLLGHDDIAPGRNRIPAPRSPCRVSEQPHSAAVKPPPPEQRNSSRRLP